MILVPDALARSQALFNGDAGRDFVAGPPALAEEFLGRWGLRVTGPPMHGGVALVLPVERVADGTRAVLKLTLVDEETEGEPAALRSWAGAGAVRLLGHDPDSGTMPLERLGSGRPLSSLDDPREALRTVAGLLGRLSAVPAPDGPRRLGGIAAGMLARAPETAARPGAEDAALVAECATAGGRLDAGAGAPERGVGGGGRGGPGSRTAGARADPAGREGLTRAGPEDGRVAP